MEPGKNLSSVALAALLSRITGILPTQIRSCVEELSEEQLWWRPNEQTNSVGNLVLHVSGSMRHYLSRGVGGIEYHRDRPAEFAERDDGQAALRARVERCAESPDQVFADAPVSDIE